MTDFLSRRRAAAARAWTLGDEIVVVRAGEPISIPGSGDQTFPFVPHPEYRWLADAAVPGAAVVYDAARGWTHYVPETTRAQRVWEGVEQPDGEPIARLPERLDGRRVLSLGFGDADAGLREKLKAVRRRKDDVEIDRIRRAVAATAAGFARLPELAAPGRTEREVQVELEAEFFRAGGERTAYGTIVGSGPNAAILHSTPSNRRIGKKDLVLVDAGCEVEGYCADVTRTLVRTAEQRALSDVVRDAQAAAIARCRAGEQFRDVHLGCAADLARGLVELGVLRGEPEGLVERDAVALFFPHGVGHLVGLGVRDGDSAPPRKESSRATLQYLRLDLPLEPGFVVTIEPGIYFIPALLEDRELREKHRDAVHWDRVDEMLGFGGVRIEDNVLVTDGDPDNLTAAIPK